MGKEELISIVHQLLKNRWLVLTIGTDADVCRVLPVVVVGFVSSRFVSASSIERFTIVSPVIQDI
jgi:hypothetical protein